MSTIRRVRTEMVGVPGSPYLSNMYFGALEDTQECIDKVGDFWVGVSGFMSEDLQFNVDPTVFNLDAATGEIIGSVSGAGVNNQGTDDSELMPPANQALVRWTTGVYSGGREVRGKTFIPALTVSANVDGFVNPLYPTDFATFSTDWLASGPALVIWSRKNGIAEPVTRGDMWSQFAVLRSRRD